MTVFAKRLKQLRQAKEARQQDIANSIGVTLRAYQYYETATKEPTMTRLLSLADCLGVSIDYLVGRTDNPQVAR